MAKRKRARNDNGKDTDNQMGVGATLAALKDAADKPSSTGDGVDGGDGEGGAEWEKVEHRKRKKHGNYPVILHSNNARLQSYVKLSDLQNLALYLLADGNAPQWCAVRHHNNVCKVVVLMVPGLEAGMFTGKIPLIPSAEDSAELASTKQESTTSDNDSSHPTSKPSRSPDDYYPSKLTRNRLPDELKPLADIFEHMWPVRTPGDDKYARMHSPLAAILTAPIVKTKEVKEAEKKSKGPQFPSEGRLWQNKRTPVIELLATSEELAEEGYVIHPALCSDVSTATAQAERRAINKTTASEGWVDTANIPNLKAGNVPEKEIESGSVTAGRKVFALDCEMCITSPAGVSPQVFSLTRISIVDWNGEVVLDELVKPAEPITDYLTPYSGMTAEMLQNVTTTLPDVQAKLQKLITPHTVLVGHSLNSDLTALKLTHPFIIDTALLYPHPRGPPLKSALKWLSQKYLSREIQKGHGSTGHNSIEDARACLDLVKQKCEKGKAWGTTEAAGESIFKRLARSIRAPRDKANPAGDEEPRSGAVVDWGDPMRGYGSAAKVAIGCESDADIVANVQRAVLGGDSTDPATSTSSIPVNGCDFVWARLRSLEFCRGWSSSPPTTASSSVPTLSSAVSQTTTHISEIWNALSPCTAFIVYSGSGDPRELSEMQNLQRRYKEEYKVRKWDELSVKWTDIEEQRLRKACERARLGVGFVGVK